MSVDILRNDKWAILKKKIHFTCYNYFFFRMTEDQMKHVLSRGKNCFLALLLYGYWAGHLR